MSKVVDNVGFRFDYVHIINLTITHSANSIIFEGYIDTGSNTVTELILFYGDINAASEGNTGYVKKNSLISVDIKRKVNGTVSDFISTQHSSFINYFMSNKEDRAHICFKNTYNGSDTVIQVFRFPVNKTNHYFKIEVNHCFIVDGFYTDFNTNIKTPFECGLSTYVDGLGLTHFPNENIRHVINSAQSEDAFDKLSCVGGFTFYSILLFSARDSGYTTKLHRLYNTNVYINGFVFTVSFRSESELWVQQWFIPISYYVDKTSVKSHIAVRHIGVTQGTIKPDNYHTQWSDWELWY